MLRKDKENKTSANTSTEATENKKPILLYVAYLVMLFCVCMVILENFASL